MMNQLPQILKALEFAAVRHRKQFRKGRDKSPYINHPIQVANLLAGEGGEHDAVLLTAAILHDVVEDTVNGKKEKKKLVDLIRHEFGEEVLSVTLEVTDDKSLGKKERKRLQVEHAPYLSVKARKLKLADKIMNVKDVTSNPPRRWPLARIIRYLDWSEQVVAGIRGVNPKLESLFDQALEEGRSKYSPRR
ncbi:MAG TPA: HD domain-containing protein [Bacteroidales bacterium]|nr:HD domain-containing protein [Bacteroidales bacterium]